MMRGREYGWVFMSCINFFCVCRSLEEGSLLKPSESMPDQAALMS